MSITIAAWAAAADGNCRGSPLSSSMMSNTPPSRRRTSTKYRWDGTPAGSTRHSVVVIGSGSLAAHRVEPRATQRGLVTGVASIHHQPVTLRPHIYRLVITRVNPVRVRSADEASAREAPFARRIGRIAVASSHVLLPEARSVRGGTVCRGQPAGISQPT